MGSFELLEGETVRDLADLENKDLCAKYVDLDTFLGPGILRYSFIHFRQSHV